MEPRTHETPTLRREVLCASGAAALSALVALAGCSRTTSPRQTTSAEPPKAPDNPLADTVIRSLEEGRAAVRDAAAHNVDWIKLYPGGAYSFGPNGEDRYVTTYPLPVLQALVEGGARLAGALLDAGLVDRFVTYVAPLVLGADATPVFGTPGPPTLARAVRLRLVAVTTLGDDVRLDHERPSGRQP